MQAQALAIGVITKFTSDYYFGGMLNGIHQVTRAAGVPLLVIQDGLQDLRLPPLGAAHVVGWIILHPGEDDTAKLVTLAASGVPVVTVASAPDTVACSSVVVDNRGDTQALVNHLIDHGHRQIACIDHGPDRWSRERYQGYLDALHEHGIALDPTLVIDTAAILPDIGAPHPERCGAHAARELIARGVPCTALVAGIDQTAIAAMQVLQDAGYRVPEDVAVVGFDDIVDAQYAQPPLTTVRTRFDAMGRVAAEHLLAILRGERDAQPTYIFAPTRVLHRRSCGCADVDEIQAHGAAAVATARDWQDALAEQLVALVVYPLAPDPSTPPDQTWPGVHTLLEALAAALEGQDSGRFAAGIESAWQQAVALTENQDILDAALTLLEATAEQRLASAPLATRPVITALFRQLRKTMMRAWLGYVATKNQVLTTLSRANQSVNLTLLASQVGESQSLAWLRHTPANWGGLGLWDTAPADPVAALTVAGIYQPDSAPRIALGASYSARAFPPIAALPLPIQQGYDLTLVCPLRAGVDELGVLALCGFADWNFAFDDRYTLELQTVLLGATLKRDIQAQELAQARDAAQAANVELTHARDAAEAANKAKSAFVAQMSHELRTPLNGILGFAQILQRQEMNSATLNGLRIIHQSGEHLLTLIDDILDLAKIEAGRLALTLSPVQLPTFLEGITGIIRARAEAKQLRLIFDATPDLPTWVQVDETRLRQILLNLLGNAVKFTDQGQVTLRVSCSDECPVTSDESQPPLVTRHSALVRFEVIDTGPGIAPDQLERIFQPFEQAGELRRRAEGAGLGLAISRQLVQLIGGELHVDSELGCGCTFWFAVLLPVVAAAVAPASERLIVGYTGRRRTLLVVDDVESNRAVLVAMLAPLGFRVHVAADGRQAIALAQQLRPDLILIDRQMPVLSGPDVMRQIRQIPALRDMPIIATSASVLAVDQAMSHAADCDNFLPKPIRLPQLAALLERHLQLEWVYDTDTDLAETVGVVGATEALDLPPAEELAALFELAQIGDILAIQARAAQIKQRDPRWRAFAHRLAHLADQFEVEQILALLARYRPPNRHA